MKPSGVGVEGVGDMPCGKWGQKESSIVTPNTLCFDEIFPIIVNNLK